MIGHYPKWAGSDATEQTMERGLRRLPMTVESRVPGRPVGFILISRETAVKIEREGVVGRRQNAAGDIGTV